MLCAYVGRARGRTRKKIQSAAPRRRPRVHTSIVGAGASRPKKTKKMSAPTTPIRHLFITLRRGLAGVREDHRAVIASLGLRRREQTVRRRNDAALRGAVEKVRGIGCLASG